MANCGTSFLTKGIHSLLSEVHSVKLLRWDQSQDTIQINRATLTVMIRAHYGRNECCLNWNVYDVVNFK